METKELSSTETITKEGFKLSPLGPIPQDWEVKEIKCFGKVITGNTPATNDQSNYGDEFMFVSPADLGNNKYITTTEKKLTQKGFESSRKFPKGTVLFTCIGSTIGKLGIASEALTSNQQINVVICNENHSNEFLFYELARNSEKIKLLAGEQAVPIINKTQFESIKVICPPFVEQHSIATLLSTWDAAIAKQQALIAAKEQCKKWLMQQLLTGKKRLKGFSGEWKTVKLSQFTKKVKGKVFEVSDDKSGLPCITASTFDKNYTDFTNSTDAVHCNKNDVLILWDGENAGTVTTGHIGAIGSTVAKLILKGGLNNYFLSYLLNLTNPKLKAIREGSGIPHMPGDFEDWYHLNLPSLAEQIATATVIIAADKELLLLNQKLEQLKEQKKGLMQVLLTGKKRLKY